jgi:hypothetical protein
MTTLRAPQQVVPCVMSTTESHGAWIHHNDHDGQYDRYALGVDDQIWADETFVLAVRDRANRSVEGWDTPTWTQIVQAVYAELQSRADAYADV